MMIIFLSLSADYGEDFKAITVLEQLIEEYKKEISTRRNLGNDNE